MIYDRQINKFNRQYAEIWPAFQSNTGTNLCIVRYADVLLMAAEALCMMTPGTPPPKKLSIMSIRFVSALTASSTDVNSSTVSRSPMPDRKTPP
ncbi:MAG: RagB/SusD family nutrient uptake outer membrane protein [Alistipes senegalensis]